MHPDPHTPEDVESTEVDQDPRGLFARVLFDRTDGGEASGKITWREKLGCLAWLFALIAFIAATTWPVWIWAYSDWAD